MTAIAEEQALRFIGLRYRPNMNDCVAVVVKRDIGPVELHQMQEKLQKLNAEPLGHVFKWHNTAVKELDLNGLQSRISAMVEKDPEDRRISFYEGVMAALLADSRVKKFSHLDPSKKKGPHLTAK